ncbi:helix-turn-helix domain-containing protein [Archangium lansingense]|uniref:Helix-turn-helix transcriptional regulator n=1 Tax=Archangium lansingense TaxID=2995310 RepID=A0ABT4AJB4_9BACT|nr:helix-turn-helix transcriptional regulator [Archangium lansinium]MCY1081797.1 helix-turn-helix transcriptional regulator [Archangium lansinium]
MEDDLLQKTIGEAARTAREGLGLTQAQVAQKAGMSAQVYGRIERGGMMPSVPALRRLAAALGVSPAVLLDMSPREVPSSGNDLSPETRRVVGLLRTWPEYKVAIGRELLLVLDAAPMREE